MDTLKTYLMWVKMWVWWYKMKLKTNDNNDKCPCVCKKPIRQWAWEGDYAWNPSTCACECDKNWEID